MVYNGHEFNDEWLDEQEWIPSGNGFQVLTGSSYYAVCRVSVFSNSREQNDTSVLISMAPDLLRRVAELESENAELLEANIALVDKQHGCVNDYGDWVGK